MNKRTMVMLSLCIGIAVMAIAYAAFSTTLTISGTSTQIGTFAVKLANCSCTTTTGIASGTAPTGSCLPFGGGVGTTGTVTASFVQPGDKVTCTFDVKNDGNLKAKADGNISCTPSGGVVASASSSGSTPMWYSATWNKTALAGGATASKDITIEMTYSTSITSQPSTTTGSVSCTFGYTQDI